MSEASEVSLEMLDGLSIGDMMEVLSDFGYSTSALSNEEIVELYVSVIDGHKDEDDDYGLDELSFDIEF